MISKYWSLFIFQIYKTGSISLFTFYRTGTISFFDTGSYSVLDPIHGRHYYTSNVITVDVLVSNGSNDIAAIILISKFAERTMKKYSVKDAKNF